MTWGDLLSQLYQKANQQRIPLTGSFELTPRCNLSCVMCFINQAVNDQACKEKELSAREWISLAQEARDAGMLRLLLTGGEVFVRKDFREIYEAVSQMGLMVQLFTNGTLITPEIAAWLGKMPPSQIGVTVYGASPESYARVCGSAEAYHLAFRGIDLLVANGMKPQVRMTLIRKNVADFDRVLEYADQKGLIFLKGLDISPRRDKTTMKPVLERLSPEELLEFIKTKSVKKDEEESLPREEKLTLDEKVKKQYPSTQKAVYCGAGYDSFWLNWKGHMTYCGDIEEPYVLPLETGFKRAWTKLQHIVDKVPFCEECRKCELHKYCVYCPARLKNETGSYQKCAPYFKQIALLLKEEKEKKRSKTKHK